MKKSLFTCLLVLLSIMGLLTACQNIEGTEKTKIVLTTGFNQNEIFRIEKLSCTIPEIMLFLTNTQNQYESVYGEEIWKKDIKGITLEDNIKEMVLARMAQIKTMNLLADKNKVSLTDKEKETVKQAAEEYFNSLNETEIEKMGISLDTIISLYSEYATANKVYFYIIKDINPEISDDEARNIKVQHILIKTYTTNGLGEKINYSESMKKEAYIQAVKVLDQAKSGEDFEMLMDEYSEDSRGSYSFGKGEMDKDFEEAAFQLGTDEISKIVESQYGYHIIKCISTFDKEETDANKIKIMEQRKKEVFNKEYEEFVDSLNKNMNKKLWEKVTFIHNDKVKTQDFFHIYDKYFAK